MYQGFTPSECSFIFFTLYDNFLHMRAYHNKNKKKLKYKIILGIETNTIVNYITQDRYSISPSSRGR